MRARSGTRFSATSRRGRGPRPVASRVEAPGEGSALLPVIAVAVLLIALVAGFTWSMDRTLRAGILDQRAEAMQRPDWVSLRALPPHVALAFLVALDPSFLHRGPLETGREGPTLSRELVGQVHGLREGLGGQARQMVMGPLLEARLSEDQLLELFLNRVYLGDDEGWPVYGVFHAAREFFGKEPQQLTVSEAATLAGLLLPPRITDPQRQIGAVGIRRNEVLRQMVESEAISAEEMAAALQEPLAFQPGLEFQPMTRPAGWDRDPDVIRLPSELVAPADTIPG